MRVRWGPWYGRNTVCAAHVRMSRRERQRRSRQKVCVTLTFEWEKRSRRECPPFKILKYRQGGECAVARPSAVAGKGTP